MNELLNISISKEIHIYRLMFKKIDESCFLQRKLSFFIADMIQSIEYLHKNSFFHRDIKPGNTLIDHDLNPYISDYETIHHPIIEDEEITNNICSKHYAAPELYKGKNVSFPTDIYSFGVLIEELIKKTDIKNVSKNIIKLYKSCKNYNPDKRPTILQIKNALLNEFNSFSIFENILTNKTEKINRNFIIQLIYEMILTVIQKQDIFNQKLCFENIFCFRRLILQKEYQDDSILNLLLGQLYRDGYDIAIKQDLFNSSKSK